MLIFNLAFLNTIGESNRILNDSTQNRGKNQTIDETDSIQTIIC